MKAPYLPYEEIAKIAEQVLKDNGRLDELPVCIEALVELDFGLRIIPERGLEDNSNVVGFLSLDLTSITVDEYVLERQPTRYRFTLAHELGHKVLHAKELGELACQSPGQWKQHYYTLPEEDYGWFERQAYWFAGAILVPEQTLFSEYHGAVERLGGKVQMGELSDHSRLTVAGSVAKRFLVSTGVLTRRLDEVGLW